jgi:hypothetical protein
MGALSRNVVEFLLLFKKKNSSIKKYLIPNKKIIKNFFEANTNSQEKDLEEKKEEKIQIKEKKATKNEKKNIKEDIFSTDFDIWRNDTANMVPLKEMVDLKKKQIEEGSEDIEEIKNFEEKKIEEKEEKIEEEESEEEIKNFDKIIEEEESEEEIFEENKDQSSEDQELKLKKKIDNYKKVIKNLNSIAKEKIKESTFGTFFYDDEIGVHSKKPDYVIGNLFFLIFFLIFLI